MLGHAIAERREVAELLRDMKQLIKEGKVVLNGLNVSRVLIGRKLVGRVRSPLNSMGPLNESAKCQKPTSDRISRSRVVFSQLNRDFSLRTV